MGPLRPTQILGGTAKHNLNVIKREVQNKGRFKVNYMKQIVVISAVVCIKFNVIHICILLENRFSVLSGRGRNISNL